VRSKDLLLRVFIVGSGVLVLALSVALELAGH